MKVRLMKVKDFDSIYLLWKEAELDVEDYQTEKQDAELMIKMNPKTCFVLCEGRKILGSIFGTFNGRRAWIYHLAIHPSIQDQGWGAYLLQKTLQILKELGAKRSQLWVMKTNLKVLGFYKKQGFNQLDYLIGMGKNI